MQIFRRILISIFIICNYIHSDGQVHIKNLLFNSMKNVTDFRFSTTGYKILYTNTKSSGGVAEGLAHMENTSGNMIFYVNSSGVYDSNYTLMPGSVGLLANPSSTEINICPDPSDNRRFYIIYNTERFSNLYYTVVDMGLRGGLGNVSILNQLLKTGSFAEGLEIVKIPGSGNYRLITFQRNVGFTTFLISSSGFGNAEVIYPHINETSYDGRGELDYHNGYIGLAFAYAKKNQAVVAKYDPFTNSMTDFQVLNFPVSTTDGIYGLEFSPNCTYVYFSDWYNNLTTNLFQYDLASRTFTNTWFIFNDGKLPTCGGNAYGLGQIELAPNGNLYVAKDGGCKVLEIKNPDDANPSFSEINVNYILSLGISDYIQSEVYQPPSFITIDTFFCVTRNKKLALPDTFNSEIQFYWTPVNLLSDTGKRAPTMLYDTSVTYNLTTRDQNNRIVNIIDFHVTIIKPKVTIWADPYVHCLENNFFEMFDTVADFITPYTLNWDFGDGNTSRKKNPVHSYARPGHFHVKFIAVSEPGCMDSGSFFINVFDQPEAGFKTTVDSQCLDGNIFRFNNTTIPQSNSNFYTWELGDSTYSFDTAVSHSYTEEGVYKVTLAVMDSNNCTDTFSRQLFVIKNSYASFDINMDECNNTVSFINLSTGSGSKFSWDFGDGHTDTIFEPYYHYPKADTYFVTLYTDKGTLCGDYDMKKVIIENISRKLFVPDCFTPNDDNKNDTFMAYGPKAYCTNYSMCIYNRWGEKIYDSDRFPGKQPQWDGRYQGTKVQSGVYFYEIIGTGIYFKGMVTLLY